MVEYTIISLVPRPPPFFVRFAFSIYMDVWGCCRSTNSCAIKNRASFLPVKYCRSCEPQESWLSLERSMMKSSTLFERGPLPPYVNIASTRRHSRDRCSQAFPVFCTFPLPCIILNANRRTKNGGGLGTRLMYIS